LAKTAPERLSTMREYTYPKPEDGKTNVAIPTDLSGDRKMTIHLGIDSLDPTF
jgi:hypothetical protein